MVRVALVTNWDWVHVQLTLPLARALRSRGYDVSLVSPAGTFTRRLTEEGFEHVAWGLDRRGSSPVAELSSVRSLGDIYRNLGPDLVHHFTIKPNIYGSFAARRAGITRVVASFAGLGFAFSSRPAAAALRVGLIPVMRRALRHGAWTVFENEEDLATLVRRGVVDPRRARVIHGSVDTERFKPTVRTDGTPTFVMAGRLIRDKGLQELVDAAGILREEGVTARVVVAGEPDLGNPASATEDDVERWSRSGFVEFLGRVSDVPALLSSADVAVLPSYYGEGAPRFLMEAAAAGLPAIAGDIPGCRAVVEHETTGLLVRPRDARALAEAMRRLALDPVHRARLGDRARDSAEKRFSETEVIGQYMALYEAAGLPPPA